MLSLMQHALGRDDRSVVRKVLGGNLAAFRILVDRYESVVHGVAFARLHNSADAEDVAQETFLRFYQQLDQMAHRRHVGSWLISVARNVSVDVLRRRARDARAMDAERVAGAAPREVSDPVREELHRLLWDEIEKLDPGAQEVIVLHYFMKKKAREIASLLEINTNAAEKRLQRARDDLGRRLTNVLGDELGELKSDSRRADRIMAAVCGVPAIWKASAGAASAAATAAGVATGASAAKTVAGLAILILVAILGYLLYDKYLPPFRTQDVTDASTVTMTDSAYSEPAGTVPIPAESTGEDEPKTVAPEPLYPPLFGVLSGTVRYEDGTPAPGAEVWIDNHADVRDYEQGVADGLIRGTNPTEPVLLSTTTDSSGRYRISNIPLASQTHYQHLMQYTAYARKSSLIGRAAVDGNHLQREVVRDFVLQPDLPIGGVVRGANGKPVGKARVQFEELLCVASRFNGPIPHELTGPDGRFLFEHLPPASCQLTVVAEGYLIYTSPWLTTGSRDYVLQLDEGITISGRVINIDTGQPVGGVLIHGREMLDDPKRDVRGIWYHRSFDGESDSGGAFRVAGCEPGSYEISVGPKLFHSMTLTLVEPMTLTIGPQPVAGLELKMATGGVLRGKVIDDETGQPAPAGSDVRSYMGMYGSHGRGCETEADGSYELLGMHEGEHTLVVYGDWNRISRYEGKVSFKPGEVKDNFDIHLPVRPFGGVVLDDASNPVAGASVYAVRANSGWGQGAAITDTQGRFRFGIDQLEIPPSVFLQAMTDAAYSPKAGPFRTNVRNDNIVLRILKAGRLEGDVVDDTGRPLRRGVLAALPESADAVIPMGNLPINEGRSINDIMTDYGTFLFPKLHPGTYTLEVYASGHPDRALATTDVTVEAGMTTTAHLVVDLSGFGTLEGTVMADGRPAPNQRVVAEHREYRAYTRASTDQDGFYSMRGVLPGQVQVAVEPQYGFNGQRIMKTAAIVSGEVTTIDFDLFTGSGPTGSIEGYVTSGGSPTPPAVVVFKPAQTGGNEFEASVDRQGWYRMEQIPEGEYVVEAQLAGVTQTMTAHVAGGKPTRLDIEIAMAEIRGAVTGIRPGEKAYLMVFPGDSFLAEWTMSAMELLGDRMLNRCEVAEDGPFSFGFLSPGEYIVGAVAVPADAKFEPAYLMQGRVAASPVIVVAPDAPAEVELVIQ